MKNWLNRLFFRQPNEWPADEKLVRWARDADWTTGLSFEGSLHLGTSGSGKSSGGIQTQTTAMLRAGYGVLFLTTKSTSPSDAEWCREMASQSGRASSVVAIGANCTLGFNVLRYELEAAELGDHGDFAGNVASLFSAAAELAQPSRNSRGGDHIWRQAVESLVRHAVTLVFQATNDLRLDDIVAVVKSAPQSAAQLQDPVWRRESTCYEFFIRADRNGRNRNLELARSYLLGEFPNFPPETKNSVLFTFSAGCADLFQREPLHSMFFSRTDYTPEILLDGAVLICDCPVLRFGEIGQIANGLIRICAQRMLQRRTPSRGERPVAIVWDETQKTLLRSDIQFQETARSARCAVVAASQHLPALRDSVGPDLAAAFAGHLRTKLFFQSNEPETCEFMRKLAGKRLRAKPTNTTSPEGKKSQSVTDQWEDALPAQATHNLRTGGEANRFLITALLIVGSKRQKTGEPYRKIIIDQRNSFQPWWPWSERAQIVARQRPAPDFRYLGGRA